MGRQSISLALGGGGARGITHLGVLRVFEEENIGLSFIAGTSMGAVIGAMFALYRDTEEMERRIVRLVNSEFLHKAGLGSYASANTTMQKHGLDYIFGRLRQNIQLARVFTRSGTIPIEWLHEAMGYLIDDVDISELSIPYCAVATDLNEGKPVLFRSGPVRTAITASAAIPGVFTPLELEGMKLVDGAASYLTPVPVAKEYGGTPVVAVDVSKSLEHTRYSERGYGIYFRSGDIAMINYNTMLLEGADVVIRPDVAALTWADFQGYKQLIEKGYIAAKAKLPEITSLVEKESSFIQRLLGRRGANTKSP
jgi:NTE family protein